jgi:hypothetical protein
MRKVFDWLKLLIPSAGMVYLIITIFDRSYKSNLNVVMSTVLGLYVVVFGLDGMLVKRSSDNIYMFYTFIGLLILILNFKFGF